MFQKVVGAIIFLAAAIFMGANENWPAMCAALIFFLTHIVAMVAPDAQDVGYKRPTKETARTRPCMCHQDD